jgi:hypothetical protein
MSLASNPRQPPSRRSVHLDNSVSNDSVSTDTYNRRQVLIAASSTVAAANTCMAAAAALAYASGVVIEGFAGHLRRILAACWVVRPTQSSSGRLW